MIEFISVIQLITTSDDDDDDSWFLSRLYILIYYLKRKYYRIIIICSDYNESSGFHFKPLYINTTRVINYIKRSLKI